MDNIKLKLKTILGNDAFSKGDMQVSEPIQKLVKAVYYLTHQFHITSNMTEDVEIVEHIKQVIANTNEILTTKEVQNDRN